MTDLEKIEKQLKDLINMGIEARNQIRNCTVTSVDEGTLTCEVYDLVRSVTYYDVRIRSIIDDTDVGIYAIPAVNSSVLVGVIDTKLEAMVILVTSEVSKVVVNSDSVIFNGGTKGGLVNIGDLVTKINNLEDKMKNHQHTYVNVTTPAITTNDPISNPPFVNTVVADIEDDSITH